MNYFDNKERFYNSEYASQIVDNWITGVPFLMEDNDGTYDAFVFYSVDRKTSKFESVKMLVTVDVLTGEANQTDIFIDCVNGLFPIDPNPIVSIEEYLNLLEQLEDDYISLRNDYIVNHSFNKSLQEQYLKNVTKVVSKEIIDKVYKKLAPKLFTI